MFVVLLALFACAPSPGAVGDTDCTPYLPSPDTACHIWECYKVDGGGTVEEWYAWGGYDGGKFDHATTRCTDGACLANAARFAVDEACGGSS